MKEFCAALATCPHWSVITAHNSQARSLRLSGRGEVAHLRTAPYHPQSKDDFAGCDKELSTCVGPKSKLGEMCVVTLSIIIVL